MSEPTIAARDLRAGMTVAGRRVVHVAEDQGMVAVWLAGGQIPLYPPDAMVAVSTEPDAAPAPPADPRDEVIAAARAVRDAWYDEHPAGVDTTSVMGLTIGTLDARLSRLDALVADRVDIPERSAAAHPAGWGCDGRRDGQPSPHACPVCGHCADHAGGCAARTDTGRCGCTGKVVKPEGPRCARCALNDRPDVASRGVCCSSHESELCHRCYRETHLVDICIENCRDCAAEGLPIRLREAGTR